MGAYCSSHVETDLADRSELDSITPPMAINLDIFRGSLSHGKDDKVTNCWAQPGGNGFAIRGRTYLSDYAKVSRI